MAPHIDPGFPSFQLQVFMSFLALSAEHRVLLRSRSDTEQTELKFGSWSRAVCVLQIYTTTPVCVLGNGTVCAPDAVSVSFAAPVYTLGDDLTEWNRKSSALHSPV